MKNINQKDLFDVTFVETKTPTKKIHVSTKIKKDYSITTPIEELGLNSVWEKFEEWIREHRGNKTQ